MTLTMPAVLLIIALVGMLLFFGPIRCLIERTKKIGRSGIETFPPDPRQAQTQRDNGDPLALPAASAEGRLRTEDVLRDFYTPLILERDAAIRDDLAKLENQGDREKVLVRQLAAAHVIRDFERTYEDIFGSQIGVVALLNSAGAEGVEISEIRKHYDAAANQFPDMYTTKERYSFEQWLDYLKRALLIRDSVKGFAITRFGHEFLLHLARSQKPVFKPF